MLVGYFAKSAVGLCGRAPHKAKSAAAGDSLSRWVGPRPPSIWATSLGQTFRNPLLKGGFGGWCFLCSVLRPSGRCAVLFLLSVTHRPTGGPSSTSFEAAGWTGGGPCCWKTAVGGGVAGGLQSGHRASGAAGCLVRCIVGAQGCKPCPRTPPTAPSQRGYTRVHKRNMHTRGGACNSWGPRFL